MADLFLAIGRHFFEKPPSMLALMLFMQTFALLAGIQSQRTLTFSSYLRLDTTIQATINMRNSRIIYSLILLFSLTILAPACSKKSGCPATESLKPKPDKKGGFKKSKGSSSDLFPKKMRKRMK